MRASCLSEADLDAATAEMIEEVEGATARFGDFNSTHEALGVLQEEFDELKAAIHANSMEACAKESMQVAAVALRFHALCVLAMEGNAPTFKSRSGA